MTRNLTSLGILISLATFSQQKVVITGRAFDTTNGRNWVQIVLNDTLRKFRDPSHWSEYQKLTKDTNFVLFAKADGKFKINANKKDSLFFRSYRHITKVYAVAELLKMTSINIRLEPEVCIPYVRCDDSLPSKVYVFVGQKISVNYEKEPYYCDVITMDSRFVAEYKIIMQVAGKFPRDTIRFTVYDHYGRPSFSKYQNVLLFVSEYCGNLFHEKYQYFDLYKTLDGRWASPGDPYRYDGYHRKDIKAQNIKFADTVWFDISKLSEAAIKEQFPGPFYKIEGQRAIPVMGTYVDELVTVKNEGVLKARKIVID